MVNSNLNNSALGNSVVGGSSMYHKQSTLTTKKVALREVQNDNRSYVPNHPENSCILGRPVVDPIKVSGTKLLTPERPQKPSCHQFLSVSGVSDHVMHGGTGRKFDSELGKRRIQDVTGKNAECLNSKRHLLQKQPGIPEERTDKQEHETSCVPAIAPIPLASPMTFSPDKPLVSNFLRKPGNGLPAAHSRHHTFTPESVVAHLVDSERNIDEQRTERFLCLQNLLRHFDESDQSEYITMLRYLSPSDLSRHAVELEKRSMQLSVEEAKEIQRMEALNILGKSSMTCNSSLAFSMFSPKSEKQLRSKK